MPSLKPSQTWLFVLLIWTLSMGLQVAYAEDTIELLNGATLQGKVITIDREARVVEFESTIAGQKLALKYDYKNIHRVVWNDKEYIVTPKPGAANTNTGNPAKRTEAEVNALIESVGSTNPNWLASTPVEHPSSLDLNWPMPAPQP